MEDIQYSSESFKNIRELIRFTDQKAVAILVFTGILLSFYEQIIRNVSFINISNCSFWNIALFIFSFCTFVNLLLTLVIIIFKVFKPRLAKIFKKNEYSIFYFELIANMKKEKFRKLNKRISEKS